MRNFLVAITGVMGAGKSAFSQVLREQGVQVLDCDKIAKDILFEDESAKDEVRKLLGGECFDANENPLTKNIAQKVFANASLLEKYEQIIHPRARLKWEELSQKLPFCAVEVPLLFEKKLEGGFDLRVCVFVSESLRKARLLQRNMSCEEIQKRDVFQMPQAEKIAKSDVAIFNDGSKEFLKMQAQIFLNSLKSKF